MTGGQRGLAIALAAGRVAIGGGLWLAPERTARALGLKRLDARALTLARLAGTRDLILGVWQLSALGDPGALRRASAAVAAADAGDALTFALAAVQGEERTAGIRGLAAAVPAASAGAWLARTLGDQAQI